MLNIAFTSLFLGLVTTASPCILPLYPGFLAYLGSQNHAGNQKYALGFFVLAGVMSMMLALGGLIAVLSIPIGSVLRYLLPLADLVILGLGILLLFGHNPFNKLAQIQMPVTRHPYSRAFMYGLLYGPIAFPCSGPLVVAVFALSFTAREALNQLWVFLWFGVGLGIPLLILSFLSTTLQRQLTSLLARQSRKLTVVGGLILIGIAFYDLYKNWASLQLFWKTA